MRSLCNALVEVYGCLVEFNAVSVSVRIGLAVVLGALIGFERGRHGRAAGMRTHTLVCIGSCMTVMVGLYSNILLGLNGDALRVSAQVISGIGFLGAGTILTRHQFQITGLTTAAGLWATAAVGLAIGLGFYQGALLAFCAMEITVIVFSKRDPHKQVYSYYLEVMDLSCVNRFVDAYQATDVTIEVEAARSGIPAQVGILVTFNSTNDGDAIFQHLRALDYVTMVLLVT